METWSVLSRPAAALGRQLQSHGLPKLLRTTEYLPTAVASLKDDHHRVALPLSRCVGGADTRNGTVHAIERQLAHTPRDKVRAAYNYAEQLPERRRMMQAWADYLDDLRDAARARNSKRRKPEPVVSIVDDAAA